MSLHEPFRHLQHKLWQKEKPGVKLSVWFLTTKSREWTQPRCVQMEWDTSLESSQRELQLCFKPRPNQRSEQRVIVPQSCGSPNCGSPNCGSFGIPPWEFRDKKPFGCGCRGELQRVLYGGRWWLPQVWAVVSLVTMWGKEMASLESGPWWVLWIQSCPWFVLALKVLQKVS
jgi:hypothetical protein